MPFSFRFWKKKKTETELPTVVQQYEEDRARKKKEFEAQLMGIAPTVPAPTTDAPERVPWQNAKSTTRAVTESIRALAIIEEEKAVQRRKFIEESFKEFTKSFIDIKSVPVDIWLLIFHQMNVIELGRYLLSCTFFSKMAQLSMERRGLKTVAKYIALREKKKKEIMKNFYQDLKDNKVTKNPFLVSYKKTINFRPTS